MQKWEYYTAFVWAEMHEQPQQMFQQPEKLPQYAPQAMIPELNTLGRDG